MASQPPLPLSEITDFAQAARTEGLDAVVLIGQGGSSQAAMTLTKLYEVAAGGSSSVAFRTMDSLSPVFVNHILGSSDPARTLYIVSSKSGTTIEIRMLERVVWRYVAAHLGSSAAAKRFVAITDPGSPLVDLARDKHYRLTLPGPVDVGGRFSALSVFALLPAALVGIDICAALAMASLTEAQCREDSADNPAIQLACFLYEGYLAGRDKFSLVMPSSGQVLGLWIEQLIAESLGKQGVGILPYVEVDASVLSVPLADRSVITYAVGKADGFVESLKSIDPAIPRLDMVIDDPIETFSNFVIWEHATVFLSILMNVFPFDQPDVELTKTIVKSMLGGGEETEAAVDGSAVTEQSATAAQQQPGVGQADTEAQQQPAAAAQQQPTAVQQQPATATLHQPAAALDSLASVYREVYCEEPLHSQLRVSQSALMAAGIPLDCPDSDLGLDFLLRSLLASIKPGDYFALNAFLPFRGIGRREALERMRHRVATRLSVASCLEIGPRYLHSTGQLQKGGSNNGVFLIVSANEIDDLVIPGERLTLGTLVATQARADFVALAARERRAVHVHLVDNNAEILSDFADRLCTAVSAVYVR